MSKDAKRKIGDIMAAARPREASVSICLSGDLAADAERIQGQIEALGSRTMASLSLGEVDPRAALESELAEIHELMRMNTETFRFRSIGSKPYSDLLAAHPGRTSDEAWNPETFTPALISASAIDPEMTPEELDGLLEVLNDEQGAQLWRAAFRANRTDVSVPFSPADSRSPSSSGES